MNQNTYPFPGGGQAPDLGKIFKKYKSLIVAALLILLAIIIGWSSAYSVEPEEVGVVTRFGAYSKTTQPGLNWKIPFVDEVQKIPARRQLKVEFGFRTLESGVKSSFARDNMTIKESLMLTGDLNVAVVEWIVHYQIADPKQYLFKVRNVVPTLRALSEATMREVVGDYSVTEVLTRGREEILQNAKEKLSKLCTDYETGLTIQRIELKDSAPPDPVKPSFNEVNQAEQERDRLQNEAWAQYNREIPKARGEARQMIQEAEGYAVERVNRAKGEVARFLELQKEYARAPRVTRTRLYLETMNEVLPKAGKKLYVDEKTKGMVPMLFPMGQPMGGAR